MPCDRETPLTRAEVVDLERRRIADKVYAPGRAGAGSSGGARQAGPPPSSPERGDTESSAVGAQARAFDPQPGAEPSAVITFSGEDGTDIKLEFHPRLDPDDPHPAHEHALVSFGHLARLYGIDHAQATRLTPDGPEVFDLPEVDKS